MSEYIDPTAKVVESEYGAPIRLYRNVMLSRSHCGKNVSVGDDTVVERCKIGDCVALNRRSYFNDSVIGDYSYAGINTTMNFSQVGKFCSIARNVDIGGFDHSYETASTMPRFRLEQMLSGKSPVPSYGEKCEIGNDVWIAAGAQVLHKVSIGDGAIVGGGAVVTKDVPPYAIVVGVPARIIKFRFSDAIIQELEKIRWWDWPIEKIRANLDILLDERIDETVIEKMRKL